MIFYNEFYQVYLDENISLEMEQCCSSSFPNECGGILIGSYSNDLLVADITEITYEKSNQRAFFHRQGKNLINKLNCLWKEGKYYIGEWHYHPDGSPIPSHTDIYTMYNLSKSNNLKCKEPILLVIGGRAPDWEYYVCVITGGSVSILVQDD